MLFRRNKKPIFYQATRILSKGSKFFPFRENPFWDGMKKKKKKKKIIVASLYASVSIPLIQGIIIIKADLPLQV